MFKQQNSLTSFVKRSSFPHPILPTFSSPLLLPSSSNSFCVSPSSFQPFCYLSSSSLPSLPLSSLPSSFLPCIPSISFLLLHYNYADPGAYKYDISKQTVYQTNQQIKNKHTIKKTNKQTHNQKKRQTNKQTKQINKQTTNKQN